MGGLETWSPMMPSWRSKLNPSTRGGESQSFPLPSSAHPDVPKQGGPTVDGRQRIGLPKTWMVSTPSHASVASEAFCVYPPGASWGRKLSGYHNSLRVYDYHFAAPLPSMPSRWEKPVHFSRARPATMGTWSTPSLHEPSGYTRKNSSLFGSGAGAPPAAAAAADRHELDVLQRRLSSGWQLNNTSALLGGGFPCAPLDGQYSTNTAALMSSMPPPTTSTVSVPRGYNSGFTRAPLAAGAVPLAATLLAETSPDIHPKQAALRALYEVPDTLERHAHKARRAL